MGRVVGILTGRSGVEIPLRVRDFSFLNNVLAGPEAHPVSYSTVTGVILQG
jgi:hypothetical protein